MGVDVTNKLKSINQLRGGLSWATQEFKEIYFDNGILDDDKRWDNFWERIEMLIHMEEWLRRIHGYEGCIWGKNGNCKYEQPMTCDECVKDAQKV